MTDTPLPPAPFEPTPPYICPHLPHTPTRCYRRDGSPVATAFANAQDPPQQGTLIRVCVDCHLSTDAIDAIVSSG